MSKKKNTYKEFFGISEEITVSKQKDPKWIDTVSDLKRKNPDEEIKITETELEEAELINNIIDYNGGVQYMLRDAAMADNVANEIKQFALKKKIYPIKHTKSRSGKAGYFYFRLGDDPAKESQQLQGYLSQKPEIKYFRFKTMEEQRPTQNRNI